MTIKDIAELKRLISELTIVVQGLSLQLALLNQDREHDHRTLTKHEEALSGTFDNPGLVGVVRKSRDDFNNFSRVAKKIIWIMATPLLAAGAVMLVILLAERLGR